MRRRRRRLLGHTPTQEAVVSGSFSSRRPRTSRRAARTLGASLLVAGAVAGPAHAADFSAGQFKIDTDSINVVSSSNGSTAGTVSEFHAGGFIRAQYLGTVHRISTGAPCVFVRVIFTYADGTTSSRDSLRACNGELSDRSVDIQSLATRDLVRYRVELRTAVDSTSTGVAVNGVTNFVNNAPDSLGTASQLDVDRLVARKSTTTLFDGTSRNSLTSGSVRSNVTGTLTWSDVMPGTRATAQVKWTYADGTTSIVNAGTVERGPNSVAIDVTSLAGKDVRTVAVIVASQDSSQNFATQASAFAKFGDFQSP
jgi:hypothetical protein